MHLMCSSGVGMVGFGFVDNFVMITVGDAIDANLGATLGFSAIAAAGMGNAMSDVLGHYCGDAIERFAGMLGLEPPLLTDEQKESKSAESCRKHGGGIGLALGCLLGMCPLLWTGILKRPKALTDEEKDLYKSVFAPLGVGDEQFAAAIQAGEWKTVEKGMKILEAGKPKDKIILLHSGLTHAVQGDEVISTYASKTAHYALKASSSAKKDLGFFIGGSKLCQSLAEKHMDPEHHETDSQPYKYDIIAAEGSVRYLEWRFDEMIDVCNENREIERAIIAIMTKELTMRARFAKQKLEADQLTSKMHIYSLIVRAILADDVVTPGEQEFVRHYRDTHSISDDEMLMVLKENSWTVQDWERGHRTDHDHFFFKNHPFRFQ